MLRLVQNINFYIMFEVLEVSWKNLLEKLHEARDMDEIILANEQFLDTIISQLLLDQESVVSLLAIYQILFGLKEFIHCHISS